MNAKIVHLESKIIIGKRLQMSLAENKTHLLWKSFMTRRSEIKNNISNDLISMQVYQNFSDIKNFNQYTLFEKWASVEVSGFNDIPDEMESYVIPNGLYAVFQYKGSSSEGENAFKYIFENWLPNSIYNLDHRPHFEVIGEKYQNDSIDSEEEIWIPIKIK